MSLVSVQHRRHRLLTCLRETRTGLDRWKGSFTTAVNTIFFYRLATCQKPKAQNVLVGAAGDSETGPAPAWAEVMAPEAELYLWARLGRGGPVLAVAHGPQSTEHGARCDTTHVRRDTGCSCV
eukprot:5946939-Prymnesium_polylepis.1